MIFMQKVLIGVVSLVMFSGAVLWASENSTCKSYTEKELNSIRASNNPNLIMGAGIVELISNPSSTIGKDLLGLSSRTESPKGTATVSLIVHQLNSDYNQPLKPLRENVIQLLQDDKDNALSYYLNAILSQEEGRDQEALAQIKKGNSKIFNSYPKERFYAIAQAAKMAKCSETQARQHAFWNSHSGAIYIKLRHLCKKLVESYGEDTRKACYLAGQNLERGSLTFIEQLSSLAIQSDSLGDSPSNAAARAEIKKKRDDINTCRERTAIDIPETAVTDDADLEYYRILLSKGECSARDFLTDFVKRKHKGN